MPIPYVSEQAVRAPDIFDEIRAGFRFVADQAVYVRIREDRLTEYALSLQPRPPSNTLDAGHHFVSDNAEELAAYILCLEAVNFGSGYEDDLVRDGWVLVDRSIYYTVSTALKQSFEGDGAWTAMRLMRMTGDDMIRIFHLPDSPAGRTLAQLFAVSLNELGQYLSEHCDASFMTLINSAQGSAGLMVATLVNMPGFADIADYCGRRIPILKRAQIAVADLELAFAKTGRSLFSGLDRLTIFADCGLPHVLHLDGVLQLQPELAARIEAGMFLRAGSDEEVELRCCAAEAVERIAVIKGMRVVDIDHLLWHRSVEDEKYLAKPMHRTLTRFY
ncbi:MAG: hypothetical protein JWO78_2438 [Micavibrio sp.]|nr:hypothetical protein [Micavibrio sp.]